MPKSEQILEGIVTDYEALVARREAHKAELDAMTLGLARKVLAVKTDPDKTVTLTEVARAMGVHKTYPSQLAKIAENNG